MRINIFLILLVLLASCSREQLTLEQYKNYPVKFAKKPVVYPDGTFEILLPLNWNWKVENYKDIDEIILGIEAASKPEEKNFINILSIQKIEGFTIKKDLESEYNFALESQKKSSLKLIETGKSKLIGEDSFYIHSKSNTGKYGEVEIITLITKSIGDNNFYYLTASASRTNDLKLNMAVMIKCLKTFKQNKKN